MRIVIENNQDLAELHTIVLGMNRFMAAVAREITGEPDPRPALTVIENHDRPRRSKRRAILRATDDA